MGQKKNNILTKNINKTIAITNIGDFNSEYEVNKFCNKLIENLNPFGKILNIVYYGNSKDDRSYAVLTFKNAQEVNNVREAIKLYPLYEDLFIELDKEKTIRQIRPTCEYINTQDELKSNVLEISNIPNDVEATDENLKEIFGRHGDILFLDKQIKNNNTITAYAYYKNNEIARHIIDLMNGGKIDNNIINIELKTSVPSCVCIGNINFQTIDIENLINELKSFGKVETLEICEENNCLFINYENVKDAVQSKKLISTMFNNIIVEFCIPIANDYKREFFEKHKTPNEKDNNNIENTYTKDNKRDNDENNNYNESNKRTKHDENSNECSTSTSNQEVKNETSKSRKNRNRKNRYQGSQAFWSIGDNVKNDLEVKNEDIKADVDKKVDISNQNQDSKEKIELKKEDDKPIILNERKPQNKMKFVLSKRQLKIKTKIKYNDTEINMIVHYLDGSKDKLTEIFGKKEPVQFNKKIKSTNDIMNIIQSRTGHIDDSSWCCCIGYVDDDGIYYTAKMKSDFENIEKINNKLIKKNNILTMEIPNESKTFVALLPSDPRYEFMFDNILVNNTREEKTILDALGKFICFSFFIIDTIVE